MFTGVIGGVFFFQNGDYGSVFFVFFLCFTLPCHPMFSIVFCGYPFCNLYFYYVFLTLELLKHCVLRGSSFSNTVFCGGKFSRPPTLLCVFDTPKHGLR